MNYNIKYATHNAIIKVGNQETPHLVYLGPESCETKKSVIFLQNIEIIFDHVELRKI